MDFYLTNKQVMMPIMDKIMSLLRPYLSTKHMLITEPTMFRPEVMRESAMAVLLLANPANWMMVTREREKVMQMICLVSNMVSNAWSDMMHLDLFSPPMRRGPSWIFWDPLVSGSVVDLLALVVYLGPS